MLHFKYSQKVKDKLSILDEFALLVPGVVVVNDIADGSVAWMSELGRSILGVTLEEITSIQSKEYYDRYFNPEDAEYYLPKLIKLFKEDIPNSFCTYFQQVKHKNAKDWTWYMSSTKIFMRNDAGEPFLTLTIALPIDAMHHMAQKADKLLAENNFLQQNLGVYKKLTVREKDILSLVAKGKTSIEIADELFISELTVSTHKRNIKKKLNTTSTADLIMYARAYDLI